MGQTEYFGLSFFDFGDELDSPTNVQKEINRFTLIDKQLYANASIFGNGVITGWDITESTNLSITISPGVGLINSIAAETDFPENLNDLPENSTFYVYVQLTPQSLENRTVTFNYSIEADSDVDKLLLAQITTGSLNIESIDTSVRTLIGFKKIVQEELAKLRPVIDLE